MCNQKDCKECDTSIALNPVSSPIVRDLQYAVEWIVGTGGYSYNDVKELQKLVDDLEYCAAHS